MPFRFLLAGSPPSRPPAAGTPPTDRSLQQLFQQQPHECALIIIRTLWIGAVLFIILLSNSLFLLHQTWDSTTPLDRCLRASTVIRFLAAIPRPIMWIQMVRLYEEARAQPTPRQVAQRLAEVQQCPLVRANAQFSKFFHLWLVINLAVSWWFRDGTGSLSDGLYFHCWLVVGAIVLIKVLTIATFYVLLRTEVDRGIQRCTLEANAKLRPVKPEECDDRCTICVTKFTVPGTVRELNCGHIFHANCVDKWLIKYSNKCPLCMKPVGECAGRPKEE